MVNDPLLAELKPSAGINSILITTGISQQATGTVFCSNQAELVDYIDVALVPNGNLPDLTSYIAYGIKAHSGLPITLQQLCLGSGDSIYVQSRNGTTAFIFSGTTF